MSADTMLVQEVAPRDGLQIEDAFVAEVDEINMVASVSETHNRANMGMTPAASHPRPLAS